MMIEIGWNGAKLLGDEHLSRSLAWIVSHGRDWIVVRSSLDQRPYAATFSGPISLDDMIKELKS